MGGSYSTGNPSDHSNRPITFNDRSGEFQLNQLNFYIEKTLDRASKSWDFGGRADVMFGTDSRFTQTSGLDNKLIGDAAGVLFSYAVNENVTVNAGSVAGWDNFKENFGAWNSCKPIQALKW